MESLGAKFLELETGTKDAETAGGYAKGVSMKKMVLCIMALSLFQTYAHAESCRSLVITGHPSYPPVAWGTKGSITGAAPTLVTTIAKDLGVKEVVSRNFGSWASAQKAAKEGKADIIFGIYRNDEREAYLNYVDPPFMLDPVEIAVRKGERFSFEKWDDLVGKKGVTNEGESYGNEFDAFMTKNLTVERTKGVNKAYTALLDKKADYVIVGSYPGRNEAKKLGITGKIEFLPKELNSFSMYVAFSKKSKCFEALKDGFSTKIKEYSRRGVIQQLLNDADKNWSVNK